MLKIPNKPLYYRDVYITCSAMEWFCIAEGNVFVEIIVRHVHANLDNLMRFWM